MTEEFAPLGLLALQSPAYPSDSLKDASHLVLPASLWVNSMLAKPSEYVNSSWGKKIFFKQYKILW